MLPQYESFLDATPEKGVITVEYWWQPPSRLSAPPRQKTSPSIGAKTSMVFFRRILVADKCWCGSGRTFGKCHRRSDDWTYVTLDPDRQRYSPVILVERTFRGVNFAHARKRIGGDKRFLCIDNAPARAEWALPAHPPVVNDIGQLVIGSVVVTPDGLRIETNSEKRLEHLTGIVNQLLGATLDDGETRRTEPQKTFNIPGRR